MIGGSRIFAVLALLITQIAMTGCKPSDSHNETKPALNSADNAKLWQGNWRLVSATRNGQSDVLDGSWRVNGDRYEITLGGRVQERWRFSLDPATNHFRALAEWGRSGSHEDYVRATRSPDKDGVCCGREKGLYEISQDKLRIALDPVARDYPKSFDAGPGSPFTVFVFKRE